LGNDLRGDPGLTAHRIDGDDAAFQMHQCEQLRDAVISLDFASVATWPRITRGD